MYYSWFEEDYLLVLIKGSILPENRHFYCQKRFNKLIYSINMSIKFGIRQPVKFLLVSRF